MSTRSRLSRALRPAAALLAACLLTGPVAAAEKVRVSLFSWPGYGFWFIAKEKNLVPEIDLDIQIIEDPYQSFSAMALLPMRTGGMPLSGWSFPCASSFAGGGFSPW